MPEIAAYRKIAEETVGRPLKISQMCGGTDARMFADRSVIVMHSVNGENAHGDGEYVEIESVKNCLKSKRSSLTPALPEYKKHRAKMRRFFKNKKAGSFKRPAFSCNIPPKRGRGQSEPATSDRQDNR